LPANVRELHVVHYYEVIEVAYKRRDLVDTGIQQQIAGAPVNVAITLNPSLDAQQKTVIPLSFRKRLHCVRHHAVEPAQAIAAVHQNFASPTQVADPGRVEKGIKFCGKTVECDGRQRAAMQPQSRQRTQCRAESSRTCLPRWFRGGYFRGIRSRKHNKIIALQ
jgi:hypothetical protein